MENRSLMKHIYSVFFLIVCGAFSAGAQSFSVQYDTAKTYAGGHYVASNNITNLTADTITIQWRMTGSNFPTDWMDYTTICDLKNCYTTTDILSPAPKQVKYPPGLWDFHLSGNLIPVSSDGPYYMQLEVKNVDAPADTKTQTYIVSRGTASVMTAAKSASDDPVLLYPNPATTSLNVIFNGVSGVTGIGVYSIIGRQMKMYSIVDNSASLNIESLPSGIYFVKLLNAQGYVVATQKFTKQ